MEFFTFQIAGLSIDVECLFPETKEYCKAYLCEGQGVIRASVNREDIKFEREKSAREAAFEGVPEMDWSDAYLEALALYRKIAEQLPRFGTILFHGSVIAVDDEAYLFTAKSGTGKSTHTRLWRKHFGDRAVMINDDKPLLHVSEKCVTAFGTPWDGKHHLSTNRSAPLKGICVLERDTVNHIEQVDPYAVYPLLVQQTYRPADPEALGLTLQLLDRMMQTVRVYRLGCNMDPEAAVVAYRGMQK